MALLTKAEEQEERFHRMTRVFTRADRALAGDPHLTCKVVNVPGMSAPAWSDGQTITFNAAKIDAVDSLQDIIKLTGLNYHELAHILFTPRLGSQLADHAKTTGNLDSLNILEDQRIETMMCGMWAAVEPYFLATFMRYIGANPMSWPQALVLSHGRRYVPDDMQDIFRGVFQRPDLIQEFQDIIDEYREMVFPRDEGRGKYLVVRFGELLRELDNVPKDPHGHVVRPGQGAARPEMTKGSPMDSNGQANQQQAAQERDETRGQEEGEEGEGEGDGDGDDAGQSGGSAGTRRSGLSSSSGPVKAGKDAGSGKGQQDQNGDDAASSGGAGSDSGDDDREAGDDGQDGSGDGNGSDADQADKPGAVPDGTSQLGKQAGKGGHLNEAPDEFDTKSILDKIQQHITDAETNSEVLADARQKRNTILKGDGKYDLTIPKARTTNRSVDEESQRISKKFATELSRVVADMDPGWDRGHASGRINVRRAMAGDDLDTLFDRWEEGNNEAADIELVILVDASSSMDEEIDDACETMWVAKRAVESIGGQVSVYAFSSSYVSWGSRNSKVKPEHTWVMYDREERADARRYRAVAASGGTEPAQAIEEAARLFYNSRKAHKIFMIISDGAWDDARLSEEWIEKMNKAGILTTSVYLTDSPNAPHVRNPKLAHKCAVYMPVGNMNDLVKFAKSIVKAQMRLRHR